MNIHEFQAKELFVKFGVASAPGRVARTPAEAEAAAQELKSSDLVVKAQIHAGGRGKGTFKNGFKGGVHLCKTPAEAKELSSKMLGQTLVTHQTGPEGKMVNQVLIATGVDIAKEYYLAILTDRATSAPIVIASTEGGVDIETVAEKTPDKIFHEPVHPLLGLQPYQARKIAGLLGFQGAQFRQFSDLLLALYRLFIGCDCSMVEINPLVVTPDGKVLALDAKVSLDDNALFRHPEWAPWTETVIRDPRETLAHEKGLQYIGLDGSVGIIANGAGLAMSTLDVVNQVGGTAANFLDIGGGANADVMAAALEVINYDQNVKSIFVNIFGGITRGEEVAKGIVEALNRVQLKAPIVIRLDGTNAEEGRQILASAGIPESVLQSKPTMLEAARAAVAIANGNGNGK